MKAAKGERAPSTMAVKVSRPEPVLCPIPMIVLKGGTPGRRDTVSRWCANREIAPATVGYCTSDELAGRVLSPTPTQSMASEERPRSQEKAV
jgi:hypothetical protein